MRNPIFHNLFLQPNHSVILTFGCSADIYIRYVVSSKALIFLRRRYHVCVFLICMSFFNWLCCCASVLITEVEHCTKAYMGSLLIYSETIADTKKWTQIRANVKSSNFSAWIIKSDFLIYFHLSQANALFLYPLKMPENLWFWGEGV